MKKATIAMLAVLCLCGVAQAQRHIEFRWHGLYLVGDVAYGVNVDPTVDEATGLANTFSGVMPSFTAGFQFRKEAGVGVGFSYVADPSDAFSQLPLYVELRSHYLRSRLTPYTVLQVGYTLPLGLSSTPDPVSTTIDEGGLYVGIELGGRFAINRSTAVALHATYRLLQSNAVSRRDKVGTPMLTEPVVLHVVGGGVSFYFGG